MQFKNHLGASFIALTQAMPVQAKEVYPPYATTQECAIQSLRETFQPAIVEIVQEEAGVGGFVTVNDYHLSSAISIDPDTGYVDLIDINMNNVDPARNVWGKVMVDYNNGAQNAFLSAITSPDFPTDKAAAYSLELDSRMRSCAEQMLLGNLAVPSPAGLG